MQWEISALANGLSLLNIGRLKRSIGQTTRVVEH